MSGPMLLTVMGGQRRTLSAECGVVEPGADLGLGVDAHEAKGVGVGAGQCAGRVGRPLATMLFGRVPKRWALVEIDFLRVLGAGRPEVAVGTTADALARLDVIPQAPAQRSLLPGTVPCLVRVAVLLRQGVGLLKSFQLFRGYRSGFSELEL
jgi:hypothetical protein